MITPQYFHDGDNLEARVASVFGPIQTSLNLERDSFYNGAFTAEPLGQILIDLDRDPVVGAVSDETYVKSFSVIHDLFTRPGTFEYYLTLFRKIWGETVTIDFEVPDPGILNIGIDALESLFFLFMSREIIDDAYVYTEVIDDDEDNIVFQGEIGIKTQDEVDKLMREISPANIIATATLAVS